MELSGTNEVERAVNVVCVEVALNVVMMTYTDRMKVYLSIKRVSVATA